MLSKRFQPKSNAEKGKARSKKEAECPRRIRGVKRDVKAIILSPERTPSAGESPAARPKPETRLNNRQGRKA